MRQSFDTLGTNFSEISIAILIFSFKKMRLKMSSAKVSAILFRGRWVKISKVSVFYLPCVLPVKIEFKLCLSFTSTTNCVHNTELTFTTRGSFHSGQLGSYRHCRWIGSLVDIEYVRKVHPYVSTCRKWGMISTICASPASVGEWQKLQIFVSYQVMLKPYCSVEDY